MTYGKLFFVGKRPNKIGLTQNIGGVSLEGLTPDLSNYLIKHYQILSNDLPQSTSYQTGAILTAHHK